MKDATMQQLARIENILHQIRSEHLIRRQRERERAVARERLRDLEEELEMYQDRCTDNQLITRSKTWYHGVDAEQLELLEDRAGLFLLDLRWRKL